MGRYVKFLVVAWIWTFLPHLSLSEPHMISTAFDIVLKALPGTRAIQNARYRGRICQQLLLPIERESPINHRGVDFSIRTTSIPYKNTDGLIRHIKHWETAQFNWREGLLQRTLSEKSPYGTAIGKQFLPTEWQHLLKWEFQEVKDRLADTTYNGSTKSYLGSLPQLDSDQFYRLELEIYDSDALRAHLFWPRNQLLPKNETLPFHMNLWFGPFKRKDATALLKMLKTSLVGNGLSAHYYNDVDASFALLDLSNPTDTPPQNDDSPEVNIVLDNLAPVKENFQLIQTIAEALMSRQAEKQNH